MSDNRFNLKIYTSAIFTISCRTVAIMLSLIILPVIAAATPLQNRYQTYVIDTYGGGALLPAVRQQLKSSPDGGSVSIYQDRLVLQTTTANYQAVQQLLSQIDSRPQALTIAVRVGNNSSAQTNIQQGQVIISNRGIQGAGNINQSNNQQQSNNLYQVQTLSGSAASISTGTLYSLTQYRLNNHPSYNRPFGQIVIQQQVLLPTVKGIAVTPRLLPNGQVEVKLSQVEEELVKSNLPYNQNRAVQSQRLNSTIIVPRGQWVSIGQIAQTSQNQSSSYGNDSNRMSNSSTPIWLLVQ